MNGVPSIALTLASGAGNRFAVLDVPRGGGLLEALDRSALARRLCAPNALAPHPTPDGLLLLLTPRDPGRADARMVLYNADGSRPEACGNGLRCIARLARERGRAQADRFVVETDAGPRTVEVLRGPDARHAGDGVAPIVGARVGLGPVRVVEPRARLSALPRLDDGATACVAALVTVGNPHAVVLIDDERTAPVARWGAAIERHPRFPDGTNVGFLALRDGALRLRVWERGVGGTLACGSGACAAATVALREGLVRWPVELILPGGTLTVDGDPERDVRLAGPADVLGEVTFREPPRADGSSLERGAAST